MSVQSDLEAAIVSMATAKAGYAAALATDSIDPKESYSLDGENVSRESWREGLMRMIEGLDKEILNTQKTINGLNPYWISTQQRLQ